MDSTTSPHRQPSQLVPKRYGFRGPGTERCHGALAGGRSSSRHTDQAIVSRSGSSSMSGSNCPGPQSRPLQMPHIRNPASFERRRHRCRNEFRLAVKDRRDHGDAGHTARVEHRLRHQPGTADPVDSPLRGFADVDSRPHPPKQLAQFSGRNRRKAARGSLRPRPRTARSRRAAVTFGASGSFVNRMVR